MEEQIVLLVKAAMSGDEQATAQIQEIMKAAEQGDSKAQQIAQMIQQAAQQLQGSAEGSAQAMKRGGKASKKKIKKGSKGLCPCLLHRVGGRIVEVDGCTGLPIAKQGIKLIPKGEGGLPKGFQYINGRFVKDGKTYRRNNDKKLREQQKPVEIQMPQVSITQAPTWEDINKALIKPIPGQRGASVSFGSIQTTKDQSERDADIAQYNAKIVANNAKTAHDYLLGHGNATFVSPEEYAKWYQHLTPEDKLLAEYKYNGKPGATGIVSTKAEAKAKEHNAALKKEQGIANFEQALVTGHIRSGKYFEKDLEKYAKEYGISPEEMSQLIAATPDAQAYAQQLHSWGQSQTTEKKAKAVEDYTRDVMDKTGRVIVGTVANPAKPVYTAMTYHGDGSGDDLLTHMGYNQSELSDLLKDKGVIQQYTGDNWLDKGRYDVRDFALDIAGNPYSWLGTVSNGITGARNIMMNAKNGVYGAVEPVGVQGIAEKTVVNPTTGQRITINQGSPVRPVTRNPQLGELYTDPYTGQMIRTSNGQFANVGATAIDSPTLSVNGNGLLVDDAMRNQIAQMTRNNRIPGGYTQGSYHGGATKVGNTFETTPYTFTGASTMSAASAAAHRAAGMQDNNGNIAVYSPTHPGKYIPQMKSITVNRYWGSPEFQKAFGEARKAGLDTFTFGGKSYGTRLGNGGIRQFEGKTVMPAGIYTGGSGVFGQTLVSPGGTVAIDPKSTIVVSDPYATMLTPGTEWTGVDLRQLKQGGKLNYLNY